MPRWLLLLTLLINLLVPAATSAQPALPPTIEAFEAVMRAWTEKHRVYRATLAVSRQGRLVLSQGYGDAAPDTPMHVGSISKSITAACIATLVQAGRLDWTSTVGETLAEFFARAGAPRDPRVLAITIEQLLSHRAGFGSAAGDPWYNALRNLLRYKRMAAISMADILEVGLGTPLGSAPGETYRYSNFGYQTLGMIVEARTGKPYGEYCRKAVFEPVGGTVSRLSPRWSIIWATGGWQIRAPEYLAFLKAFDDDNDILFTAATKRWLKSADGKWTSNRRSPFYSLGIRIQPEADGRLTLSHGGRLDLALSDTTEGALHSDYGASMTRAHFGASWFVAYQPWPGMAAILEIDQELWRAAHAVTEWPTTDLFPALGLR